MEDLNKTTRCSFTGHRPEKLNMTEEAAKVLLCNAIENAISRGFTTFITGMAKGVDIWAGEIVLEFKKHNPSIRLIAALPYPTFNRGRTKEEKERYQKVLSSSDFVHISYSCYSPLSYQTRNMWMVDHSDLVIALFTGEPGGTRNTLKYAEQQGIEIINLLN